jgi:hypothetical protein
MGSKPNPLKFFIFIYYLTFQMFENEENEKIRFATQNVAQNYA